MVDQSRIKFLRGTFGVICQRMLLLRKKLWQKNIQVHAFGRNQWGFTKGLSCRDLVLMLVMSWILVISQGKKIGAYLGDISGAFDRVFKPYLFAELHNFGVDPMYLNFLDA